jgi:hypothetical protein
MRISNMSKWLLSPLLCLAIAIPKTAIAEDLDEDLDEFEYVEDEYDSTTDIKLDLPEFEYSLLEQGQKLTASKDVYLLSPQTFARIVNEYDFMQRKYETYLQEKLELQKLHYQYKLDVRDEQIEFLEVELDRSNNLLIKLNNNDNSDSGALWAILSFAAGCALTVGLVYAINPGVK